MILTQISQTDSILNQSNILYIRYSMCEINLNKCFKLYRDHCQVKINNRVPISISVYIRYNKTFKEKLLHTDILHLNDVLYQFCNDRMFLLYIVMI